MEIIEQRITPKSRTAETEDGIAVTDDFIAVIDGSTSKSPVRICKNRSNGRHCMLLISEFMRQVRSDINANDFCDELTGYIYRQYAGSDLKRLAYHPEERLTASCIVYSRLHRQIWMVGDCQCLVDGTLYENPKPYESILAEKRAAIARSMLDCGKATIDSLRADDTARKAIIPEMIETMRNQNRTYAVVDGFPIPKEKVRIVMLTPSSHSIILATDGYPFLRPTLADSEAALYRQLTTDPLNIGTFKATKAFIEGNNSFDDRAYIRFTV